MGGAAGVEVRHSRGAHFRFVFVTISGNISNLIIEMISLRGSVGQRSILVKVVKLLDL